MVLASPSGLLGMSLPLQDDLKKMADKEEEWETERDLLSEKVSSHKICLFCCISASHVLESDIPRVRAATRCPGESPDSVDTVAWASIQL